MKSKINFNLLICAVAIACLAVTGCKKKPVGVTPLPGSRAGAVSGGGPGGIIDAGQPGPQFGTPTGTPITGENTGYAAAPGGSHTGWAEDRDSLKMDTVYFDYDSSSIKDSEKSKIEAVAATFKSNDPGTKALKIEGNCDERGTEEYNRSLGERRAGAIREYLIHSGVAADRIDTVSYGEDKPAASGHNEAAWKQNRRGDFVVLTKP